MSKRNLPIAWQPALRWCWITWGRSTPYAQLLTLLGISPYGAPRLNVLRLIRLGLEVTYREATLSMVTAWLQAGQPVIAFVDTGELSYWSVTTNHTVVILGLEENDVLVNDPAFPNAPQRIPRGEFGLAWLNCDNVCAVIDRPAP